MNPYSRFQIVTGAVSGAVVLAGFGFLSRDILTQPLTAQSGFAFAGLTAAAVAIWYTISHHMMPIVLENKGLRARVLGRQNVEGTWLQAERSDTGTRISIIGISPGQDGFDMTGYAMNEDLDVVSNISLDHAKLSWPALSFKFRNTLVDSEDPTREGFGELQFEQGNSRPVRFHGYCKLTGTGGRYSIEGVRLNRAEDLELLETLEGREELVERYWELFFERDLRRAERKADRTSRRDARRRQMSEETLELSQTVGETGPAGKLKSQVEAAFADTEANLNTVNIKRHAR